MIKVIVYCIHLRKDFQVVILASFIVVVFDVVPELPSFGCGVRERVGANSNPPFVSAAASAIVARSSAADEFVEKCL